MLGNLADALALVGIILVAVGITLALGLGWGLASAGILLIGGAIVAANAERSSREGRAG